MKKFALKKKTLPIIAKAIISLFVPFLIYNGCIETIDEKVLITLSLDKEWLTFGSSGEKQEFTVNSNDGWKISNDGLGWLSLSQTAGVNNGVISVTANANQLTTERMATINVISDVYGVEQKAVMVMQAGVPPALSVLPTSLNFSSTAGQQPLIITSNANWTASSNSTSWLTVTPSSGSNNGTVTVTAIANPTNIQRTANVTVNASGITQTIAVTQAGINILEPEMILVAGGTFTMGCTSEQGYDCYSDEFPHQVTLKDFFIGKYEVTQAQWRSVMGNNPSYFNGDNLPVEQVSWLDVQEFINRLNSITGKQYRLPTEAEWEYAARGGNKSKGYKFSGSNTVGDVAWIWGNSNDRTHNVGGKLPNELGIYDMSGNVYEWCSDWYSPDYYFSSPQSNPTGPSSGVERVYRGGCWDLFDLLARVSSRDSWLPTSRTYLIGFRLARSTN